MRSQTHRCASVSIAAILVAGLALSATACAAGEDSENEVHTIRFGDYMPPTHYLATELIVPWQEAVVELTDGRVEFDYYPGGQLVEGSELYSALTGGVLDAAFFGPTVAAVVELPLTSVVTLPGVAAPPNPSSVTQAYNDLLHGPLYEHEWADAGMYPVLGAIAGHYQLVNRGEPVRAVEDWKGRTVRGASRLLDVMIASAGGASATVGTNEIYEALERRTIDSTITAAESVSQYVLEEVADSVSVNSELGYAGLTLGMTAEKWAELPTDIQDAIAEAAEIALERYKAYTDGLLDTMIDEIGDRIEFYELTGKDLESLRPAMDAAQDAWIAEQEQNGRPGTEMRASWLELLQRDA
ncbi:TRAP-type C4-dicarboxylate transport system substrate-binding protein [Mycolicibacterium mucogenicum 261Sha1.1M5]|nr:TRAP-type C4-dicarboxylate transport system substrate-binding protein [Mycolicibacterium mucogenicum 261Sha1.1M5]